MQFLLHLGEAPYRCLAQAPALHELARRDARARGIGIEDVGKGIARLLLAKGETRAAAQVVCVNESLLRLRSRSLYQLHLVSFRILLQYPLRVVDRKTRVVD